MSEDRKATEDRRRFLKIVGGSAVLVPIIGLDRMFRRQGQNTRFGCREAESHASRVEVDCSCRSTGEIQRHAATV